MSSLLDDIKAVMASAKQLEVVSYCAGETDVKITVRRKPEPTIGRQVFNELYTGDPNLGNSIEWAATRGAILQHERVTKLIKEYYTLDASELRQRLASLDPQPASGSEGRP